MKFMISSTALSPNNQRKNIIYWQIVFIIGLWKL